MITQTKETLNAMTPEKALDILKEGNLRFVENRAEKRNLMEQMNQTSKGQFPFAGVLGCIDSRVPPELIFDLGIGDVFSIRVAGNTINEDILGSMEFACKVVGSKQIVVLGHTSCGAVQGALDDVQLGNLTGLIGKIKPAVETAKKRSTSKAQIAVDEVAEMNVKMTIEQIKQKSTILNAMLENNEIGITGAMYDVSTGKVSFF